MNLGIDFDSLETLIETFYRDFLCRSCINSKKTDCSTGTKMRLEDKEVFSEFQKKFLKETSLLPKQGKFQYILQELESLEIRLNQSYYFWKRKLEDNPHGKKSTNISLDNLKKEIEQLKVAKIDYCFGIRYYYNEWKYYYWLLEKREVLKPINSPGVAPHSSQLPYPTANDYEKLAKILLHEDSTKAYNEILKDWISKYRIGRDAFFFRYKKYLLNEYKGEKPGVLYNYLKFWWDEYGADFLNINLNPISTNLTSPQTLDTNKPSPSIKESQDYINAEDYILNLPKFQYVIKILLEDEKQFIHRNGVNEYIWDFGGKGILRYFAAFIEVLRIKGYIAKASKPSEYAYAFAPMFGINPSKLANRHFRPYELEEHKNKQAIFTKLIPPSKSLNIT